MRCGNSIGPIKNGRGEVGRVRQLQMRVNIRLSSIRKGPRPGLSAVAQRPPFRFELQQGRRRKGHLKVAHYEVVGRIFQKQPVPQGTIDWLLALARPYASEGLRVRSSLRDGVIFNAFSHHLVVGY
jgi:hypothetical protein